MKLQLNLQPWINQIHCGDALEVMQQFPDGVIDLIVTSPPYWTAVVYDQETDQNSGSYENYLKSLLKVWKECSRVLRPNGKMAINTPIMPIPKRIINDQHTRHLKNINNDIEFTILSETDFLRYSLYIWQKQTSKLMFGSYPYPGNILENNTIEFINVFVKPGSPPKFSSPIKEANQLSRAEWIDLTQQVWFMYPEDVKRGNKHPAPFPLKLPGRLIRLFTFGATDDFHGEIVLDPFCGTGTTCVAAKMMGRRYIGIDISEYYIEIARSRLDTENQNNFILSVGRPKYAGKQELLSLDVGTSGKTAENQHKRKTYGRKISPKEIQQLKNV